LSQRDLVIETVHKLPQEATIDEIVEGIALLAALRKGEWHADSGRGVSHEHVRERVAAWLSIS
jgi:predicted transcriptional regulator